MNTVQAIRLVAKLRPRIVVSAGANAAVPFCILARLTGSKVLFVEAIARVRRPSLSARLVYPFSSALLVPWPELAVGRRKAHVCRPMLLDRIASREAPAPEPEGTYVGAGTHNQRFNRLANLVDDAEREGLLRARSSARSSPR